jgi:membrane protein required for colicin V production
MHWLDCTILAILAAAAVLGAYTGLLMQLFRLVGFAVALYAATCLHAAVSNWLHDTVMHNADSQVCTAVAFAGLFLAVYLGIFFATWLLERGVNAAQLQYLNRGLGALLGVVKMSLIVGAVCYGLQQLPFDQTREIIEDSLMAPILARCVQHTLTAVPTDYQTEMSESWKHVRDALPGKTTKPKAGP